MKNEEIQKQNLRTWIEVSQQALKNNYGVFRRLVGQKCLMMAVVKSNAYGHGLIDFSRATENLGVDWFGVDSIIEAESLRESGLKKPILVLGYTLQNKIKSALKNDVSLTISDFQSLKNLKNIDKNNSKLKIHLKIDTGMHRQGFFISEIPDVIKILKSKTLPVILEGIYTHFSSAKNPAFPSATLSQLREFKKVINLLESAGFKIPIKHASATAGTIIFPQSHFDLVRIGIGLHGLWPSKETKEAFKGKLKLEPVLSWKTIVGQIKNLPQGSSIGYDLTETLNRPSRVAVLPIGYWHGLPRSLSSIGKALINGNEARILGRVSMDMISVDITDIKNVKVGNEVVLIGKSGKLEFSADNMADLSDTSSYEIVTRLNPLIKRFY
ncbi:MAG: alanine racemase [Candidatus Yanofskybacteria bacterium RIFCSPHIGHO2_02_FULL_39_10]|uniref:Alanine racemase n=1 Tax=Candidatus Yanofskybacteria bacterium RIFCSPHIGHO2_02_FULL_39_10 TaxID=1802674 RepID=A0A1F8FBB6_9BACT|nr:MAG: alanine racemase [Candidatus Yanofskybacteria bacterium RIFCSPHIGHO2_02_FULL_39_10]